MPKMDFFSREAQHFLARAPKYSVTMVQWPLLAIAVGAVCGAVGSVFSICNTWATQMRLANGWLLYTLPVLGLIITALYSLAGYKKSHPGTNLVVRGLRNGEQAPLRMAGLIFAGTVLTHLGGGSSGREGAALQIGGSMGSAVAAIAKLDKGKTATIEACGMAAVFSALFGTPLTAAIFVLEVAEVGTMHYSALLPTLLAALTAGWVAGIFGVEGEVFHVAAVSVTPANALRVILLASLCAMLSYVFCLVMHMTDHFVHTVIENGYLRVAAGGAVVVVLTLLLGTRDYNGAGMNIIAQAIEEGTLNSPFAFAIKIVLTAITLGVGFKGGEIVPTFFVGATFGCLVGGVLGLPAGFAASVGLLALFCGVVNCPIASILLGIELFGAEGMLLYAVAVAASYIVSGTCSLYATQKLDYSKLNIELAELESEGLPEE